MIEWNVDDLRRLLSGMRQAYAQGGNAMAQAREELGQDQNHILATVIAYDLQAGSYTAEALQMADDRAMWCNQVADVLSPLVTRASSILEVGCGEATTLRGVVERLNRPRLQIFGFDLSWSRLLYARKWLAGCSFAPNLFAANLFNIPLADSSVDVVYTSHSLEPNGGRELEALQELTRVARKAVVVIEPIFELASEDAQERMASHGYIRGLGAQAEKVGRVTRCELLPFTLHALNPSGVIVIEVDKDGLTQSSPWRCPVTGQPLRDHGDAFVSHDAGLAYPVLRRIPILLPHYAIIASHFEESESRA